MRAGKRFARRGAAVLIALLTFFLAALSGTVALTMSASNAGRFSHKEEDNQAYYSVMSAVNLIIDELENLQVTVVFVKDTDNSYYFDLAMSQMSGSALFEYIRDDFVTNIGFRVQDPDSNYYMNKGPEEGVQYEAKIPIAFSLSLSGSAAGPVAVTLDTDRSPAELIFTLWYKGNASSNYQTTVTVHTYPGGNFENGNIDGKDVAKQTFSWKDENNKMNVTIEAVRDTATQGGTGNAETNP